VKLSFTLGGGLGDYILSYLGSPGNRLAYLSTLAEIDFRVSAQCSAGLDLVKNNPYFKQASIYQEDKFGQNKLDNDISCIKNISDYPQLKPSLWLSDQEEEILNHLESPYGIFHPFAGDFSRNLSNTFPIGFLSQWIADVSGFPIIVLGNEDFNYSSDNVKQIKGSARLSVKIVERSSFFVGSHSSMQCAAWVYDIPSFCIAPDLLLHNLMAPYGHDIYLKPLFGEKNVFMMYEQAGRFSYFLDYFLKGISLRPCKTPEEYRRLLVRSHMVF
jgi:hypothetical protein